MSGGRRAWVIGGIGALAAAGGAGWYTHRSAAPLPGDGAEGAEGGPVDLWNQRFPQPDGGELALAGLRGKPLLINFWATWCPPCVKEMPELDRFWRNHGQQLAVVGLAIDSPDPVKLFLQRLPVGFAIGLAGFPGTELARNLGNASGSLPFTVLLNARGDVVQRKLGETSYSELEGWLRKL